MRHDTPAHQTFTFVTDSACHERTACDNVEDYYRIQNRNYVPYMPH